MNIHLNSIKILGSPRIFLDFHGFACFRNRSACNNAC